ncbi:MAG: glycosyltransferase family 39 protein [Anaerolineae bacterium]
MRKPSLAVPTYVWLITIIMLGAAVRLYRLGYQSLWYDEAFSWAVATAPLKIGLAAILSDGGNPPLYQYFVLHPLHYLGQSEEIIRLPSVFFGILSIPLIYKVGRLCFGQKVGLVSALWLSLSPIHVWYSQEARMYAMVVLLSLGSVYFFLLTLRSSDWKLWLGFIVFTALAYPTSYSAFLVTLAQLIFIICTFRTHYLILRQWALSQALAFLPTLPWVIALLSRKMKSFGFGWIARPGPLDPLKTLWNFSLGYTEILTPLVSLSLLLFAFALLRGLWDQRSGSEGDPPQIPLFPYAKLFLALWLILPIGFVFLVSHLLVSIYIDRFLLVALPPYLILVAYGLLRIRHGIARRGLIFALTLAISLSLSRIYFDAEYYTKEDWRGAAQYITQHEQAGDVIALRLAASALPFEYYYQGQLERVPITKLGMTQPIEDMAAGHQRLWLVRPHHHDSTHLLAKSQPQLSEADETDPLFLRWVNDHRSDIVEVKEFSGLRLTLYMLSH